MTSTADWPFKDMMGDDIREGHNVAKATTHGRSAFIEIRHVTRIERGRIYLDDSKVPIQCPERLLVLGYG